MKKVITLLLVSVVITTGLFAFDGQTSANFAYSYNDNNHYLGISSDSVGFFNNSSFGYYVGTDALFNVQNINEWNINMLVGPSYRYSFGQTGVNLNVSLGVSASGSPTSFSFGLGSFWGAEWQFVKNIGLTVGTKIGSNFVEVPFNGDKVTLTPDFYVTPSIGLNFYY